MVESAPTGRALSHGRQLSLFKGKRQRGAAPPSSTEFALHCAVADVIRRFLMFFRSTGEVCFMELKRRGNRLTEEQAAMAAFMRDAGHGYNCVDNFEDAIMTLKAWGIVRAGIEVQ